MATMKDVALEAGVSIATVSYYINNKKKVSEDKAKRIYDAIKKLNYFVQNSGRDLRLSANKDVGILFPDVTEPYLEKMISSIKGFLSQQQKSFVFELSDGIPENESRILLDFAGRKLSGIILYTCQPNNSDIFKMLIDSGIPLVFIDRKPSSIECNYVSCDNYSLFYHLTSHLIADGKKDIALVCGPSDYDEIKAARSGYLSALQEYDLTPVDNRTIVTSYLRESGFRAGIQLIENSGGSLDAVLTTSFRLAEGLRYAMKMNHIRAGIDIEIFTPGDSVDDVFYSDTTINKSSRSAFDIGESAVKLLISNMKSPVVFDYQQIVVKDAFEEPLESIQNVTAAQASSPISANMKCELNVMLLDDYYSVIGLQHLLVDFYMKEHIHVNIIKVLPETAFDYLQSVFSDPNSGIDVVLFDVPWLRYFAENKYLLNLDDFYTQHDVPQIQFIPGLIDDFGKVGKHYYAMPYMSCTELLYYRKDLFNNDALSNEFEKRFLIPLKAPKNWLQFNTISKFFSQKYNPNSPVKYGHAMALSYTEQIMCDFFPRLWSYGGSIFDAAGKPNINSRQARNALKNMLESVSIAHPALLTDRPMDNVDKFIQGETAMLYTFFNYATPIVDPLKSSVAHKFGFARLPGRTPILAGWSLGINQHSKYPEEAFRFLKWACGTDIAIPHTILGGQSPNIKVYHNYDLVTLYPWLPMALSEFPQCRKRELPLRINRVKYSEKMIEELIASEIKVLILKTLEQGLPDISELEKSLETIQTRLEQIVR